MWAEFPQESHQCNFVYQGRTDRKLSLGLLSKEVFNMYVSKNKPQEGTSCTPMSVCLVCLESRMLLYLKK